MRLKKYLISVLILICAFMLLIAGCGENDSKKEPESKKITITDSAGRIVELPQPIDKVVILDSGVAESVRILKVQDMVVGVNDYIQGLPYLKMKDKVSVGTSSKPSLEKILELKPQVVIYRSGPGEELAEKLEPAGVKVVLLDLHKVERYDNDLKTLAKMFNKEKRANEFLKWKSEQEKKLSDRLKDLKQEDRKKVFQVWASRLAKNEWQTTNKRELIEMAGGINVAKDLEQDNPIVSVEWILQQNPDVISISISGESTLGYIITNYDDASKLREQVLQNKAIAMTNACKNKQVYVYASSGGKPYINAQFLAKWMYPERFKDVDPENALKEYFEKWLDVPFQGKWVYPLPSK
jgi:iron complex transport system substrate-binding protein